MLENTKELYNHQENNLQMEESALARGKDQFKCGVLQTEVHAVEVT